MPLGRHPRFGTHRATLLGSVFASAWFLGCGNADDARDRAITAATEAAFGEDERLSVDIAPGAILQVVEEDEPVVTARAAAPYPVVGFDNGRAVTQALVLVLTNGDVDAALNPIALPLPADARQDPDCADIGSDATLIYGPQAPSAAAGTTLTFRVEVPPCTRLELHAQPATDVDAVRVAVVGSANGQTGFVDDALRTARALDVDFVHVLGNVALAGDSPAYSTVNGLFQDASMPFAVSMGSQDARRYEDQFIETFGTPDYMMDIGHVRLANLDSSGSLLSEAQFRSLERLSPGRVPGVVLTHEAPLPVGTAPGWRNGAQAARLIERAGGRGFVALVSGAASGADRRTIGELQLEEIGGADRGNAERTLAVITIERPWSVLDPCDDSLDCGGTRVCDLGFCRQLCASDADCGDGCPAGSPCACLAGTCGVPCATDDACPGAAPSCELGACRLDPVINIETMGF